ncbi:hypothetical protein SAMN06295981_0198 [Corynebacterium pollutisoli]|uniref:Uncharacterized protein n=2 Tax=Corynebacterium pollutisoli TaxID=1610489 RepID=A0A1X7HXQ9_9CORY|nr:hypothetical protein SAMN06295981_0198 [Corynebacterium pollutisoli]
MRRRPQQKQSSELSTTPSVASTSPPSEQNPPTPPSSSSPEPNPELAQLRQIATVLGDLVPAVNQMSSNQESLSQRLRTLEETVSSRLPSPPPSDDSESSISEFVSATTLLTLVEQSQEQSQLLSQQMSEMIVGVRNQNSAVKSALDLLGRHQQVTLPDGTQMSSDDFKNMKNGQAVVAETRRLISSSDKLISTLEAAGTPRITVDTRQLAQQATRDLDKRLSHAVGQSVSGATQQLQQASADTVAQINTAASKAATTVAKRLAQASQHLDQVNKAADRTERRVKNIVAWMPWSNLGRVLAALIPFVLALLVISGVVHTVVVDVLGLPILSVWLWSQMVAAPTWWATLLWATAGLSSVAGLLWASYAVGHWLYDRYQGWR